MGEVIKERGLAVKPGELKARGKEGAARVRGEERR